MATKIIGARQHGADIAHGYLTVRHRPELRRRKHQGMRMLASLEDSTGLPSSMPCRQQNLKARVRRFRRPGRIAGSVNVDYQELIDPDTHAPLPKE